MDAMVGDQTLKTAAKGRRGVDLLGDNPVKGKKQDDDSMAMEAGKAALPGDGVDPGTASMKTHEEQFYSGLEAVKIINLPPEQRVKRILAMQPMELIDFRKSLSQAELAAMVNDTWSVTTHAPGGITRPDEELLAGLGAATGVHLLSQPPLALSDLPVANVGVVGPDYFATMNIPLRAGRLFNAQELAEEKHVTIINQAFADKYLHGINPLGQKAAIYMKSFAENEIQPSEIIGVVGDVHQSGLDTAPEPTVYWPHPELVMSGMTILVRTSNDPLAMVSRARNELQQIDPELPVAAVATMDQLLADSLSRSRFTMLLLGIFAAVALVLASVGIYGLIAYSVTQRRQELGIRIALGAQRRDVLRLVLVQGTRLTLLGVAVGVLAALAFSRLLATLLFGVSATDPLTFAGVSALLAFVALLACFIPARSATRVDPIVALRHE